MTEGQGVGQKKNISISFAKLMSNISTFTGTSSTVTKIPNTLQYDSVKISCKCS